jgi:tetratricopeptide (TPR) repeat protein
MACYNDHDTSLTELRDNLDVTKAIIGRYTLYPPEYYRKRIEIQSAILKNDPNNLDAYDNISVAYDRIGQGDEALKWIHEKRKHLANAPKSQFYSTEANEGTFLIVRWIRGHKQGDLTDAIESEKHIAKALEINPDAHFGREFAQLYCIRAMIECGKNDNWQSKFTESLISVADKAKIDHKKLRFGIAGMMVLGAAWQMPPMYQAIANLVPEEQQVVALCAIKLGRFNNILEPEKKSLDELKNFPVGSWDGVQNADVHYMRELISNGAKFQMSQLGWISDKLEKGEHTDTNPDFWTGFKPPSELNPKNLTRATWWTPYRRILGVVVPWLIAFGIIALPIYLIAKAVGAIVRRFSRK